MELHFRRKSFVKPCKVARHEKRLRVIKDLFNLYTNKGKLSFIFRGGVFRAPCRVVYVHCLFYGFNEHSVERKTNTSLLPTVVISRMIILAVSRMFRV